MKVIYTARHTTITPDIKEYCEKRVKSLEKLIGHSIDADVLLSVEKYRHKVEINLKTKMASFNTVEETHDMTSSLVGAFDHLEKRVKKGREKLRERKRRRTREASAFAFSEERGTPQKRVIRSQNYSIKPMSLEEAITQFEAGKNEILMFRTAGKENWAVLYRRRDGHYGLMEPE
jgi:putative sigma-54 modulation protein